MSNRLNQEREAELQPKRIAKVVETLTKLGYVVTYDTTKVQFVWNGNKITIFPYSGWFSGKGITDGRGFENLLKQLK